MTTMTMEEQIDQWSNPDRQREFDQITLAKLMYKIFKSSPYGRWPEGRKYIHAAYWLAEAPPYIQDRFGETPDQQKLVSLWEEAGGSFYVEDGHLRFLSFEEMDEEEKEYFNHHTSSRIDIAGYSRNNDLLLGVQVKKRREASPDWAMQYRRSYLVPKAQYFLLATPEAFYLWKNTASIGRDAPPDYRINAKEVLAPYLDRFSLSLEEISVQGFELLIATCLQDLISSDLSPEMAPPHLQWLFESGLYNALKNGLVLMEEAA